MSETSIYEEVKSQKTTPSRSGCRWDANEVAILLTSLSEGKSIEEIAIYLQRTEKAIRYRIMTIGYDMIYKENMNIDYVCNRLGLEKETFSRWIERRHVQLNKDVSMRDLYMLMWEIREELKNKNS